ncbi:MFS transporter [Saccharothrix sp. ST-888]|uniref:MFS transporter n=1 Tax=Saccharothrix sp. ST-888 TaxID=1427391 RepID=UPI0005EC2EE4|nr:MFS transporter [Saccharothrix sp. ST-888]KJK56551.1 MFS transporter [Saccharothrix sp. ST-888]
MSDTETPSEPAPRAGRREWTGLAVLALPTLLVSIDVFVMLLALPSLSNALGASSVQQLWITDIYPFMLAGLLITMGTLGDRIGRRRLLLIGAGAFGLASIASAYAVSPAMLIAARALLGIAGATLAPGTLSLISTMFRDPKQRGAAIGIWGACFSAGAIIGPLVGGTMLDHFWWGSAFLLGVPAMVLLLVLGPVFLPEYRNPDAGRLDLVSVLASLAAILPAIWGLKEIARDGWQAVPIAALLVGIGFGVAFVHRQRRLPNPLLDLSLFGHRAFTAALVSMFLGTMLTGAVMFFVTQTLQLLYNRDPFHAGLWMLPAILANTVSFIVSPKLGQRYRPAYLIGGGLLICTLGMLVITRAQADSGPAVLITGFTLVFLGAGPLVTLGMGLVFGTAPQEKAGAAAALNETSGQLGFALGIAALGSIGAAVYHGSISMPDGLPADAARAAKDSLTGAKDAARDLPGTVADTLLAPAREAFATELHTVVTIAAALLLATAVLVTALLRHMPPTGQPSAEAAAGPAEDRDAVTATG